MATERCGRGTGSHGDAPAPNWSSPTPFPPRTRYSKGVTPAPGVAVPTVSQPDGTVLGRFTFDAQDAEVLTKRVHELDLYRYGQIFSEDLEAVMRRFQ